MIKFKWMSQPIYKLLFFQQNKYSETRVGLREASDGCKGVLGAAKLAYANVAKESINPQKLGSWDFWQIAKCSQQR